MDPDKFKSLLTQEWTEEVLTPSVSIAQGEAFDILWELRLTLGIYFVYCGISRPMVRIEEIVKLAEKVGQGLSIITATLQHFRDGTSYPVVFALPTRCADLRPFEVSQIAVLCYSARVMLEYVAKPLDLDALRRIRDTLLHRPLHSVHDLLEEGPRIGQIDTTRLLAQLIKDLPS